MDPTQKQRLIDAYRRYGFHLARDRTADGLLVFTLKTGYFDNADIVKLSSAAPVDGIFEEFTKSGFACTIREINSAASAEEALFQGFFSIDVTRKRLLEDYRRFSSSLVAPYGPGATYNYINGPYQINGKEGRTTVITEVLQRINDSDPVLFLIEAAAGFGKTCTALEIVKHLAEGAEQIPLYAELSRNRQARIFRYILLDEIDRTFPLLSSALVQAEIRNGRVATILDGFDELLRKNETTGEFENTEPMLETVSELLTGKSKVILTTRRTVLFDGDEFHQWLERHAENFKLIRIRLQEPKIADWLGEDRLTRLRDHGVEMDAVSNPVILSYLRCVDIQRFDEIISDSESLVDSYFDFMLDRERHRQDLRMSIGDQTRALTRIARDMLDGGYTAEQREYIVNLVLSDSKSIDDCRAQYPASEKPSREEIANKIASHALLDRSAVDSNKIGFINDFSLGNYVALSILSQSQWLGDDLRFIEPAVKAFRSRGLEARLQLFGALKESQEYLDVASRIEVQTSLTLELPCNISDDEAEGLELEGVAISASAISRFVFNDCTFRECTIFPSSLSEVTFLNCKFYDCEVVDQPSAGAIYYLGSVSSPDISAKIGTYASAAGSQIAGLSSDLLADQTLLRRFWPIGESFHAKPSRPIFRPIKHLCRATDKCPSIDLFRSVERLKKRGLLEEMSKTGLITLNISNISDAQRILGGGHA